MNRDELDEGKRLLAAMTPGPWTAVCRDSTKRDDDYAHKGHHLGWEIEEVDQPERGQFVRGYDASGIVWLVWLVNNAVERLEDAREMQAWQRYAAYCRCCAKSGESDPIEFEAFKLMETGGQKP